MRLHQPTSPPVDFPNVVNLSFYRRDKLRRSTRPLKVQATHSLRPRNNPQREFWLDADYRERMKVNAFVFVFLMLFVLSGIWILDGLSDAFGPERLSRQHSPPRDVSSTTVMQVAHAVRDLF